MFSRAASRFLVSLTDLPFYDTLWYERVILSFSFFFFFLLIRQINFNILWLINNKKRRKIYGKNLIRILHRHHYRKVNYKTITMKQLLKNYILVINVLKHTTYIPRLPQITISTHKQASPPVFQILHNSNTNSWPTWSLKFPLSEARDTLSSREDNSRWPRRSMRKPGHTHRHVGL